MVSVKVHRVFPSSCTELHLHSNFNFIKTILETVGQSLHHLCRTELTRQGILLPQDHQSYGRRLLEFIKYSVNHIFFTLQHWAGVRFYTSFFNLTKSYVFIKQSLPPLFFLHYAFLFPKLRNKFAEFLQYCYLFCCHLFNQFTCVRVSTVNL